MKKGGRFPSTDLIVAPSRGLQVPLSPSGSSFADEHDQDRDVIAAAGNQPGHYAEDLASPTHAEGVERAADEDGINPYTALPLNSSNVHPDSVQREKYTPSAGQTAAAGVGGAALGAAGLKMYQEQEQQAPSHPQQLEAIAAQESATIAAPDTNEQQAAHEATFLAAPDTDTAPDTPLSDTTFGGSDVAAAPFPTSTTSPPRPAVDTHQSNFSISQLHVPGEFPKVAK